MKDNIVAIATPLGFSAIGVIRLSGPDVIDIVKKIFIPKKEKDLKEVLSHTIHYGNIVYKNEIIDEVLVAVYKAPKSYTGEDMVEIFTHGSPIILEEILKILVEEGARIAERGEFTKRAFLNGKVDLLQAESINEIIRAESKIALKRALSKLKGELSRKLRDLKSKVEYLRIYLEASIDFPEDVEEKEKEDWIRNIEEIKKEVSDLLEKAEKGDWIREGYGVILVGRPNVGKSSLFNALMREDRAIVTPIPGTTRDYIEGELYLSSGHLVKIYDTAGLGIPKDILDKMGMERTEKILEKSNLILFVVDGSCEASEEEINLLEKIKSYQNKKLILVVNKIDLPQKVDLSVFPKDIEKIFVSAKERKGIEEIEKVIERHITSQDVEDGIFLNMYHREKLKEVYNLCEEGLNVLKNLPQSLDVLGDIIYDMDRAFGEILGEEVSLDITDKIFENFCVGK
ncbi:tRNA uridine-5-carboxymethylaminomethyl(34) synthesis GTPase MnmE [Dictyoglomus thermophilum]|uniref:tRNA modification GTPase MnmE n=1 Tax=Dictyoglomus thermophilum (strain ATCC 35947 / DSM 3960 / H-6-12) TaxID=309799 RepID=B5YBN4_DICT6|nr:tRNA uridine-5-carboxymethylaminomethyl(34) synthesis GTPase MnmE [Dictyoglomus thermophilum]ACI18854.1 tRNA modification GTPase TrmE [Dictyoglomus thermophilum H-6-12]